jgi:hypothetical protein
LAQHGTVDERELPLASQVVAPVVGHDAVQPSPSVSAADLRRAMQAAGESAMPSRGSLVPPIVRVDPREQNLDRAFVRAFAWAFYIDPSFFAHVPTGRGQVTIQLAEDGRIRQVIWSASGAPPRLKELVQRMTKLLSGNHFRLSDDTDTERDERSYVIAVTEDRVGPDVVATIAPGAAGDIWMLAAGDTPMPGHPSHPAVADATGHKLSGEIRIMER